MNAPSIDIADLLILSSSGLSFVQGTDLFIGQEPDIPDECITIYDRPGFAPENIIEVYDKPGFMVRIRGAKKDYSGAYNNAQDIKEYLHKMADETINATRYIGIWAEGDANFIGYDDNNRPIFTLNFICHRS